MSCFPGMIILILLTTLIAVTLIATHYIMGININNYPYLNINSYPLIYTG